MQHKKIGPLLLSGLMIGPILGSGIIILPPLVYAVAGNWAFPAWMLIVVVSFFFASIFGQLSLLFPGDAGVMDAVEEAFGPRVKKLASMYLIGAVLFGPVAVMLTASQYLQLGSGIHIALIALPILALCTWLLLQQLTSIGSFSLLISSLVVVTLFGGGITTVFQHHQEITALPAFSGHDFGYALLLLFWTVVGWEVVGNYSADIQCPEKTIPRAITFSVSIMALVSLTVAAAVQMVAPTVTQGHSIDVTAIITPLFGNTSTIVMAVLVASLCMTSYLLFTGAVARLLASMAAEGIWFLPRTFAGKSQNNAPAMAIISLTLFHAVVLVAVYFDLASIEKLVALADGFFIANALTGILAAIKLLQSRILKAASIILACIFTGILLHASPVVVALIVLMALYCCANRLPAWYRSCPKN